MTLPVPLLAALAGLAMAASQWLIWAYAPVEATLGPVQKIFYIHLPLAWWALLSFGVTFVASVLYLLKKNIRFDLLAGAAAEIGVLFSGLALVTGSIWGRVSWNVWWTWDPRLTTTLVMWFIYAAYLLVRGLEMPRERKATVAAVLGVVAFLDVPLVFWSARLWRSVHPAVFASKEGGLTGEMATTVIACVAAWFFVWICLLLTRRRQLLQQERLLALQQTLSARN
ncbi:MAG: cytochrome c biogenesis protein [Desulfovibrio sp.]|nr:cytochrome c biogenesis protein [Desulfovibrio sp.]MCA1986847.1 cytochrome c biogenesis protein [Desulfovibrio sp.]